MENVRARIPFFSRRRWGVKNLAPWKIIVQHTVHQFHENDLFTPAAAMSWRSDIPVSGPLRISAT